MIVRLEVPTDQAAVREVVCAAFGREDEARLVDRLRRDKAVTLSLVAEELGRIIGHLMLSRMSAPFPALGMAPVSVTPAAQGRGVGSALIEQAVKRASAGRFEAVFVLGDPRYYGRFGFDVAAARGFACRYAGPHFAVLPLKRELPSRTGEVAYAAAFAD